MTEGFNYNSPRAKAARLGKKLSKLQGVLVLLTVCFGVLGGYLIYVQSQFAWIELGTMVIMIMVLIWQKYYLTRVPVRQQNPPSINDVLSVNCLANLPAEPTLQKIAQMVMQTRSGRFLAMRFGLGPGVLELLTAQMSNDPTPIWAAAMTMRERLGVEQVSGGMLAVAIVENYPGYEQVLGKMQLELTDLYAGLNWYNYLHGLVKEARKPKRTGGIARDMMFGYIPLLQRFGRNVSDERSGAMRIQIHQAARQEDLVKMVQIMSGGGRQNVAIVGPEGSGRTTLVNAFAELLLDADGPVPANLKFRQVFMLDAATLISAANKPGQLETLMMRLFNEAYAAKNIILCLDNAHLFFEEGTGSVDIANVLQPALEAGNLRMILIMNNQKYLEIADQRPALTNVLNKIVVEPAGREETMLVMEDQVPVLEYKHKVTYTWRSLTEAYRLSERYVHDLVMPGRALSLLEAAANFSSDGLVVAESVQRAVEKTEGVKLAVSNNAAEERSKLLNLEELIHQRMVDQTEAVKTVSDALRRAAAGVRNENRPVGTFLFLGPTGVGKTELAKALGEVYFGGEGKLIRIDLNEYVTAEDVTRLIADGASDEMSLAAQVMKQPFAVVLLDEIEKAHPQVLTTLLQLLDEGILRDIKGREVSFRDTIVIATSNAGAEMIRERVAAGNFDTAAMREELTNTLIKSGEFKAEFLNRFDEICVFKPLSKEDLVKVAELLVAAVNKTLAPQKITVTLDEGALAELVERGYDPQLGARPMRRTIQQTVENIVAKKVLSGELESGGELRISKEMLGN